MDINIFKIFSLLLRKWWIIVLSALICAILAFSYSYFCIMPLYTSRTTLYVNNNDQVYADKISSSDVSAAQQLIGAYTTIIEGNKVCKMVAEDCGNKYTAGEISGMVSTSSKNDTPIIEIKVSCENAEDAQLIANFVVTNGIREIQRIIASTGVQKVEEPELPTSTSYPNNRLYLLLGFLVGAFLSIAVIFIFDILDTRIKSEEDFTEEFPNISVLGIIPRIEV